jgi:CRISPR-associated DxTHG motif protein
VLCLLTDGARKACWEDFKREIETDGAKAQAIDIPNGDSTEEIANIIDQVAVLIEPGARLTIDITHGLRHVPIVMYALALYLSSLREVAIAGAWYGKLETSLPTKPLINLKPLLELPRWFHAVEIFRETGSTTALASRFDGVDVSKLQGPARGAPKETAKILRQFAVPYEIGLPLELGIAAGAIATRFDKYPLHEMVGLELPLASELGQLVREGAIPLRFSGNEALSGGQKSKKWKCSVTLTQDELQRQARIIDQYLEREQSALGLSLMREWVVSLGIYHNGNRDQWLERNERLRIERNIGALALRELKDYLDDAQKEWSEFWNQLGEQRNQIAHCGMKEDEVKPDSAKIRNHWKKISNADHCWQPLGGGGGRVLVSPVGMSPGVLYSAIRKVTPRTVVALCSGEAKPGVEEAIRQAGFMGKLEYAIMEDPFNGIKETSRIRGSVRKLLIDADEVFVNLTGGTTIMGVVVQALAEQARNDQRPCRRFVLIDKRQAEEQRNAPWVESELHWPDDDCDAESESVDA